MSPPPSPPPQMAEWRTVIVRHNPTEQLSHPVWIPILNHLADALIIRPRDLATWSHAEISLVGDSSPNPDAILGLFRATLVVCAPVPSATPESSWKLPDSAHSLAAGFVFRLCRKLPALAHFPPLKALWVFLRNFRFLGPAANIRCLAESTADRAQIFRYLNTGDQVNILRLVQDSLKW